MTQIAGSTVLITGGASGLGELMGLGMARLGADVVLWDIAADRLETVGQDIKQATGREVHTFEVDVTDRDLVYATADRVREVVGDVDIVINNAGVVSGKPLLELDDDAIRKTFEVNALALYWVTKAFLPAMVEHNRGHVVTIASAAGWVSTAGQTDYSASKRAAVGFDESLRQELRQTAPRVRTTVVCPYYIDTGMFEGVTSRFPWLTPVLEPRPVITKVVDAILRDRPRLLLPYRSVILPPLFRVLPVRWFDAALDFLGLNRSMDTFVGRTRPEDVS
ncbi:MAG: SDR family oxidoreductase [Actinobacteria bacterium]|nr:SDR family oxidoreductase [Actinomycetota bacterium]